MSNTLLFQESGEFLAENVIMYVLSERMDKFHDFLQAINRVDHEMAERVKEIWQEQVGPPYP